MITHLVVKHGLDGMKEEISHFKAILQVLQAQAHMHEVNHDFSLWCCRDMLSFDFVEKDCFKDFMSKTTPSVELPNRSTLAGKGLLDIYWTLNVSVKDELKHFKAVLTDDELTMAADRLMLDKMVIEISKTQQIFELDEQFSAPDDDENDVSAIDVNLTASSSTSTMAPDTIHQHPHNTFKNSCPTRRVPTRRLQ
jgi:hypothetical protein